MLALPRPHRKLSLLAAAALAVPLLAAAPSASAGDVNWRVTLGNHDRGHYDRGHHRGGVRGELRGEFRGKFRGEFRGRGGYYKSVWRAPVYRTRYDDCGRAIRVCVRRGYYDRVWVSAPRHRVTYRSDHHPRHQRDNRRYRRGCSW
ncbi:MAG: hypothetical protein AAGL98_03345 [Planctomycetota bacterium]